MKTILTLIAYFNEEWWFDVTQGPVTKWKLWPQLGVLMLLLVGFLAIVWPINKTHSINTFAFTIILLGSVGTREKPYNYVKHLIALIASYWLLYWFFPRTMYLLLLSMLMGAIMYVSIMGLRSIYGEIKWRRRKQYKKPITLIQIKRR